MENLIELKNTDLMLVFKDKELKLKLSIFWNGGNFCSYIFEHNEIELQRGNDFRPSPLHNIDDNETLISLLSFLTVQPGDTDDNYFKDYTNAMMKFCKSFECEQLKCLVCDFDDKNSEYFAESNKYFQDHIQQYPELDKPQLLMF